MRVESLLKIGQAQQALEYLRSEVVAPEFEHPSLAFRRLELNVLRACDMKDELVARALDLLENVESDSIDEWRILAEFAPDLDSLLAKYDDGRRLSPFLIRI
jgi:hypothetical protein